MKPLLSLGNWTIPSWHFFVFFGSLGGILLFQKRLLHYPLISLRKRQIYSSELSFLSLVLGWLGARFIGELSFQLQGGQTFSWFTGPMAISGSWMVFCLGGRIWCRLRKFSWGDFLTLAFPSLAFALSVGRVGCFFNGCDYGLSVSIQHPFFYSYQSQLYHLPWPLIESTAALTLFFIYQTTSFFQKFGQRCGWSATMSLLLVRICLDPLRGGHPAFFIDWLPNLHLSIHILLIIFLILTRPLHEVDTSVPADS
jgi:phosphatidylglycerol:prolipoprotein diacylglycerol transferase